MAKQIRVIVYATCVGLVIWAYFGLWPLGAVPLHLRYGFLAVILLYLTLLASPLYIAFPKLPHKITYLRARKALGLSAFSFALLHGITSLNDALGGFNMLIRLEFPYLWPYLFGYAALGILTVMAATSTPQAINRLGKYWKKLHRLIYIAGTFVLFHVVLINSSFRLPLLIDLLSLLSLSFLFTLQMYRLNKFAKENYKTLQNTTFWPYISAFMLIILMLYTISI
ncbi:MAG: hypothetical protein KatS3mg101_0677 [Patescibacteria group bacterium]|nr:MAG: hypothetical protein KatS3mg101_0677 [Patescibacteria group bacterium]